MEKLEYQLIRCIAIHDYIEELLQLKFNYYEDYEPANDNVKEILKIDKIRDTLIENTICNLIQERKELLDEILKNKHMQYCYNHLFNCLSLVENKETQERYMVAESNYELKENEEFIICPQQENYMEFLRKSTIKTYMDKKYKGFRIVK